MDRRPNLYELAGGTPFFEGLVNRFYDGVATDPELLRVYPQPHDLTLARRHLALFLAQYWGGPHTYDHERGHPMLRMRHMPFRVGATERDHWLANMSAAVAAVCADHVDRDIADELMAYFVKTAEHMRNDTGLPITSATYVER